MCFGGDCPVKESCYRFMAEPNEYMQSYFLTPPFENSTCKMYWGEASESIFNQLNREDFQRHLNDLNLLVSMRGLCTALDYLHDVAKIIHNHLTPELDFN